MTYHEPKKYLRIPAPYMPIFVRGEEIAANSVEHPRWSHATHESYGQTFHMPTCSDLRAWLDFLAKHLSDDEIGAALALGLWMRVQAKITRLKEQATRPPKLPKHRNPWFPKQETFRKKCLTKGAECDTVPPTIGTKPEAGR